MCTVVNGEEALGVDGGVALGGGEARVAQELLDAAEIAAAREQVSCEAVAERVRRRGLGQAQERAQPLHLALNQARIERPAPHAHEEWTLCSQTMRAECQILGDSLAHRREYRHEPCLAALAGEAEPPGPERSLG